MTNASKFCDFLPRRDGRKTFWAGRTRVGNGARDVPGKMGRWRYAYCSSSLSAQGIAWPSLFSVYHRLDVSEGWVGDRKGGIPWRNVRSASQWLRLFSPLGWMREGPQREEFKVGYVTEWARAWAKTMVARTDREWCIDGWQLYSSRWQLLN
jgi:hypothetical protein